MADQLKLTDAAFDAKSQAIHAYSVSNATKLLITVATMATFGTLNTAWVTMWAISRNASTSSQVDKENTKTAKSGLLAFLRNFIKQYYYDNPIATNSDITGAGLIPHSTSHSAVVFDTSEIPAVVSELLAGKKISLTFKNKASKRAKPLGVKSMRVRWSIGATPPVDTSTFTLFKDFTKQPMVLNFTTDQVGSNIAIAICYITNKAKEGTYCAQIHTVVPN